MRDWQAELGELRTREASLTSQAFNAALVANGAGIATLVTLAGNLDDPGFALKALAPMVSGFGLGLGLAFISVWIAIGSVKFQRGIWSKVSIFVDQFSAVTAIYESFQRDASGRVASTFIARRQRTREIDHVERILNKSFAIVLSQLKDADSSLDRNAISWIWLSILATILNVASLGIFVFQCIVLLDKFSNESISLERKRAIVAISTDTVPINRPATTLRIPST